MRVGIYRRGRIWWARWTQDGKKSYRSLQTDNRKISVELALRLQKGLLLGDEPCKPPRVPIERLLDEYEAWSKANKRPRTVLNDTARIRGYTDFAGIRFVDEVSTASVMKFMAHRAVHDSISPATQMRHREVLHALMNFAARAGYGFLGSRASLVSAPTR